MNEIYAALSDGEAAEKKAALDQWASHLMVAVAQASGANITSLRKR